ncbi:tetratricopeptide repeat protein [Shouchella patagoniensis]|uniref:tetratricopeptide repeat protein n=1 Tax=Shouchella patagoniensis TaxID=228576 RepID=UPI0009951EFE|nr:tetratricopeptide repeat protein [Shouchella patagoniensis]
MDEWIGKWNSLYQSVWKSPVNQSDLHINTLEQMAQQLLDTWGSMDEALQILKQRVSHLGPLYHYQTEGTRLFNEQNFHEALHYLKNELAVGELDTIRQLYIGFASLYVEELDESKACFFYTLQASNDPFIHHFAYLGLGLIEMVNQQVEKAILYMEKANCLADNPDVVYNLGICYYWIESYEYAAVCLRQYAVSCNDVDSLVIFGLALYKNNEKDEARGAWMEYAETSEDTEQLLSLAKLTEWFGEHELACYCYEQLMLIHGKTGDLLHGFAWNKALAGDARAIDLLDDLGQTDVSAKQSWLLIKSAAELDGNGTDPVN